MALDYATQVSLGIMAGTLEQWRRDNPDALEPDEQGLGNADSFGMYAMATGFLRMYFELMQAGVVQPLAQLKPSDTQEIN